MDITNTNLSKKIASITGLLSALHGNTNLADVGAVKKKKNQTSRKWSLTTLLLLDRSSHILAVPLNIAEEFVVHCAQDHVTGSSHFRCGVLGWVSIAEYYAQLLFFFTLCKSQ